MAGSANSWAAPNILGADILVRWPADRSPTATTLDIGHFPGSYAKDDEGQEKPKKQRVEHKMAFLDPDNDDLAFQWFSKRLLFKDRLSIGLNEGNP